MDPRSSDLGSLTALAGWVFGRAAAIILAELSGGAASSSLILPTSTAMSAATYGYDGAPCPAYRYDIAQGIVELCRLANRGAVQ